MNVCYKCGREVEHGNECEPFCFSDEDSAIEINPKDFVQIDWSKVTTFEDLKLVLAEIGLDMVWKKGPSYEKLKRFCKEESES